MSGYGENGVGDTGDNWRVVVTGAGSRLSCLVLFVFLSQGPWIRGWTMKLQHVDTGNFLRADSNARYGDPIPGQLEVYLRLLLRSRAPLHSTQIQTGRSRRVSSSPPVPATTN